MVVTPVNVVSTYDPRDAWKHTHVTYGISGDFSDATEITSLLEIQPSRAFGKGDEYIGHLDRNTSGVQRRPYGVWTLASIPAIASDDPLDHVLFIVNIIEPKIDIISELRNSRGLRTGAWISEARWEGKLGYGFPAELLTRLCRLCDDVSFSTNTIDQPPGVT